MTQRVFDIENEKDMADLWDILPDDIKTVEKWNDCYLSGKEPTLFYCDIIRINWHDKTEITRPVDYEDMIGCVGWFWDNNDEKKTLGVLTLTGYSPKGNFRFVQGNNYDVYSNFCPAKKSELKFYGGNND